jgi:hypothetical protein
MPVSIKRFVLSLSLLYSLMFVPPFVAVSQTSQSAPTPAAASAPTVVPALVPYSGVAVKSDGVPLSGEVSIGFLIFKDETGGEPLFSETQSVTLDPTGHFKVNLGTTLPNGISADLFSTGEARWLEVQIAGESPQARVLLVSVPYAMKAADAATLGGLPASAFLLASQLKPAAGRNTVLPEVTSSTVTTTGGMAGYVPEFTGASTIANSAIFVKGSNVGIGITNPTFPLQVVGATLLNGGLAVIGNSFYEGPAVVFPIGTATASTGFNSQPFRFNASAWNSTTSTAVSPRFQWQAEVLDNNTAAPSATLNLLSSTSGAAPSETGFHFNANGTMNFAPGQTFPGTGAGTITGVTAGTGLIGGGTSGTVMLNVDATKIPQLNASNTFVGNQTVTGNVGASGTVSSQGEGSFDTSGKANVGVSGLGTANGVSGQATGAAANSAGVNGFESASTGQVYGVNGNTGSTGNGAAGVNGYEGATTGTVYGVHGTTNSTGNGASGLNGFEGATSGQVFGVSGNTNSATNGAAGVSGYEGATAGTVFGVAGGTSSTANGAAGVNGFANALTGQVFGVFGGTSSTTNFASGVSGNEGATTGTVFGVNGTTSSTGNGAAAVNGFEGATSGQVYGVSGGTNSTSNGAAGVRGYEGGGSGQVFGVSGSTNSSTNYSSGIQGGENATTGIVYGVFGGSNSATNNAAGVSGFENATTGTVYGVTGGTNSTGFASAAVNGYEGATSGQVYGVLGGTSSSTSGAAGVSGNANATTGNVNGVSGFTNSPNGNGVLGVDNATSGFAVGVTGLTNSSTGAGVNGFSNAVSGGTGVNGNAPTGGVAVKGGNQACSGGTCTIVSGIAGLFSSGAGGTLLLGTSGTTLTTQTTRFSVDSSGNGYFAGNLNVTGKLTKGSGSFKIDDPLDPANKYLSHSFVESPDMMNVYNGNIITDRRGLATVELPEYFDALNRDFRYQLTVMGQFAQAIVAKKVANNRFVIRTSKPNIEVSWQVTGIRHDAYANANRIPVEEDKPAGERGYYLHPEVFGKPVSKGMSRPATRSRGRR